MSENIDTCQYCCCNLGHHLYNCPTLEKEVIVNMAKGIYSFMGENRWLSNFWMCPVSLDGVVYPSIEHAYQAAKTFVSEEREAIRTCGSPSNAKRMGTKIPLRTDWSQVKLGIMEDLLRQKFAPKTEYAEKLKATKGELVEGNYWHDVFWGVCACKKHNCTGDNHLGELLMKIRSEL